MSFKNNTPKDLSDLTKLNHASLLFSFRWVLIGGVSFKRPIKATSYKQIQSKTIFKNDI